MLHRVWDKLGITLSVVCLIHCLALPVLVISFPFLHHSFLGSESFHQIFAALIVCTALLAFIPGYKKHGNKLMIFLAVAGVSLLLLGIYQGHNHRMHGHLEELIFSVSGSILLVSAHWLNIKNCRCVGHNH